MSALFMSSVVTEQRGGGGSTATETDEFLGIVGLCCTYDMPKHEHRLPRCYEAHKGGPPPRLLLTRILEFNTPFGRAL